VRDRECEGRAVVWCGRVVEGRAGEVEVRLLVSVAWARGWVGFHGRELHDELRADVDRMVWLILFMEVLIEACEF
jgi:hypothetical protein